MIVLSTRCFSSRSAILVSTRRLIPFAQNSLFKRLFHHLLYFLVFKTLFYHLFSDLIMTLAKRRNVVYKILICFYEMFYCNFLSLNKQNNRNLLILVNQFFSRPTAQKANKKQRRLVNFCILEIFQRLFCVNTKFCE